MCFHRKYARGRTYCLLHVDACFTNIGFCVVSQKFYGIKFKFFWKIYNSDYVKNTCSMMIGLSPVLEMALYTLCFLTRPNQTCPISYSDQHFQIRTATEDGKFRGALFDL